MGSRRTPEFYEGCRLRSVNEQRIRAAIRMKRVAEDHPGGKAATTPKVRKTTKPAKLPVLRKHVDVDAIANAASKELATLTDLPAINRFAEEKYRLKKIIGDATGKHTDINKIARPWLEAIVKGGRILTEMAKAGKRHKGHGDQKSELRRVTPIPTLDDLGFTKPRAARWQLAGELPDDLRKKLFDKIENSPEGILTLAALKEEASSYVAQKRRAKSRNAKRLADGMEMRIGDCREVLADVPDNTVPLILTDPPYIEEAEPLYRWLAEWSARVLIPGGSLICYTGHHSLNRDMKIFDEHLRYWWELVMMQHQSKRLPGKFVIADFKPVLWYVKEKRRNKILVPDVLRPPKREKADHDWGQGEGGVTNLIESLTDPGELIVDPFAGTATWGRIAASMGRRWLGADIVEGGTTTVVAEPVDFAEAAE
jgi:adenine-specific DNA-methyltransferase